MFNEELRYADGSVFFQKETELYFIDFIPNNGKELIITFENAERPDTPRPDKFRVPWGGKFLASKGYCILGIKPKFVDWYRGKCLHSFFRCQEFKKFAGQFEKVTFYGSSMGGFAALTFSDALPGANVIAFNPQSTLDPTLTAWDDRYPQGNKQHWGGDFNDAAKFCKRAKMIYLAYDPFCIEDNLHAKRISDNNENIRPLKMPLVGHVIMAWMLQAKILQAFIEGALTESLDDHGCRVLARSRKRLPRYYFTMGQRSANEKVIFSCICRILSLPLVPDDFAAMIRDLSNKIKDRSSIVPELITIKPADQLINMNVIRGYCYLLKKVADLGFVKEALDISLVLEARANESVHNLINIAECLYRQNEVVRSLHYADKAISVDPKLGNAYRLKSRILLKLQEPKEALATAQKSLDVEPNNHSGLIDCFNAYLKLGDFTRARDVANMVYNKYRNKNCIERLERLSKAEK